MFKFLDILSVYCHSSRYANEPKAMYVAQQNERKVIPYLYLLTTKVAMILFLLGQEHYLAAGFLALMLYAAIGDFKKALQKAKNVFLVHHLTDARVEDLAPCDPLPFQVTSEVVYRDIEDDVWYCPPPTAAIVYGKGQFLGPDEWTVLSGYDEFNRCRMDFYRLYDDTIEARKDVFGWLFLTVLCFLVYLVTMIQPL